MVGEIKKGIEVCLVLFYVTKKFLVGNGKSENGLFGGVGVDALKDAQGNHGAK